MDSGVSRSARQTGPQRPAFYEIQYHTGCALIGCARQSGYWRITDVLSIHVQMCESVGRLGLGKCEIKRLRKQNLPYLIDFGQHIQLQKLSGVLCLAAIYKLVTDAIIPSFSFTIFVFILHRTINGISPLVAGSKLNVKNWVNS